MANTDLIDTVLGRITSENLQMAHWGEALVPDGLDDAPVEACGTTMCFAGHTVVAVGEEIEWIPLTRFDYTTGKEITYGYSAEYTKAGERIEIRARELLDLTRDQAQSIFHETGIGRDVDRLREHVENVLTNKALAYDYDDDADDEWEGDDLDF